MCKLEIQRAPASRSIRDMITSVPNYNYTLYAINYTL